MTEALKVPAAIDAIIQRIDASTDDVNEMAVAEEINIARKALVEPSEAERLAAWADALAFAFSNNNAGDNPWNSYFGPMGSWVDKDGNTHYSPDIAGTPPIVIDHWTQRAASLHHPVLVARYADVGWEFATTIGQKKRDPQLARTAIDAYVKSAGGGFRPQDYYRYEALERALELSILLKDHERVDAVRAEFMRLHRESMVNDKGQWWRAFDRLVLDKNTRLTEGERNEIVADLEAVVSQRSDTAAANFDPHVTESAAERLIKLYVREYRGEDVARLYLVVAKSFEHFASLGNAMLAASLLQTSLNAYARAGLPDEAKRVRIEMQKKIGDSRNEMRSFGTDVTIKKDDIESFLKGAILPDLGQTFTKLAVEFLPKRKTLEEAVKKSAEDAPLMAHISQQIMSDDRVVAVIGSVEDDPFGRCFQQAKFTYSFSYIWMREAFKRLQETHEVLPEHFVTWANRHGLFNDMSLLLEGVRAFYAGDHVKAAHVLIPQIEHGLRAIAGQLGKPVTKAHPKVKGASVLINMGDILYDEEIATKLGDDLTLYFLSLYADPRGLNLRNELAHGDLDMAGMNDHLSLLLIHTLLVVGLWKEFAASFAKKKVSETK